MQAIPENAELLAGGLADGARFLDHRGEVSKSLATCIPREARRAALFALIEGNMRHRYHGAARFRCDY